MELHKMFKIATYTIGFVLFASISSISYAKSKVDRLTDEILLLKKEIHELKNKEPSSAPTSNNMSVLEKAIESTQDKLGNRAIAHAFEGQKLDIGGFLHTAYTYVDAEGGSLGSFNRQNFELLIGAQITDSWSAFLAGGFLRESNDPFQIGTRTDPQFDTNNRNPLIIGWVNYQKSDMFNVRLGRMITPHGIINIEHFPATLYDPEQPQFLRPFGGNTIFPNFSTGVQVHGKHFGESFNFEYATYAVNATGIGGVLDSNSEEIVGTRFVFGTSDDSVRVGLNFSDSYRGTTQSDNTMQGLDLYVDLGDFQLKSEFYSTDEDVGGDRSAYYIQPIYSLSDRWAVFFRHDFLDGGDVYGESTENVLGLNYTPTFNVRLRLTFTNKQFDQEAPLSDTDADIIQFSGTFSF